MKLARTNPRTSSQTSQETAPAFRERQRLARQDLKRAGVRAPRKVDASRPEHQESMLRVG